MQPFPNPARARRTKASPPGELYPYYAGYSDAFVADAIRWADVSPESVLLDPWNGAGTTTRIAQAHRVKSIGFDLNPVMVIVSEAELARRADGHVIPPLARKIVDASKSHTWHDHLPLDTFFCHIASNAIRALTINVWHHLVDDEEPTHDAKSLRKLSPLSSVFFVGIFNVLRSLLAPLATSNPTWIRVPSEPTQRVDASPELVFSAFIAEMDRLASLLLARPTGKEVLPITTISVGDARSLPLMDATVEAVITSPPYCTRLDYARTTMPELLAMESIGVVSYRETREKLTGTSTVRRIDPNGAQSHWGPTCAELLEKIYIHPSKASKSYYFASHQAYFDDLARSIGEISRVIRWGGRACIVAQDSHYKEIHNDVPRIISEMAREVGLYKVAEFHYPKRRSICSINSGSSAYRDRRTPIETALLFRKG